MESSDSYFPDQITSFFSMYPGPAHFSFMQWLGRKKTTSQA
jgi:hypothetical protein